MDVQRLLRDEITTKTAAELLSLAPFQVQTDATDLTDLTESQGRSALLASLKHLLEQGLLPIKTAVDRNTNTATAWWIPAHQFAQADYLTQVFTAIAPDWLHTFQEAGLFRWQEILEFFVPDWLSAIAQALSFSRPLAPYPGWYFNIEWDQPEPLHQLRQSIWEHCRQQQLPLTVNWQAAEGWQTQVHLGNDISSQLFVAGCYEPNEFWFLQQVLHPGMTVVDIGANEGLYALAAAQQVGPTGRVIALEPSQREFDRLQTNIALNQWQEIIQPYRLAMADRAGEAQLTVAVAEHAGQNTLGQLIYQGVTVAKLETVPLQRLDDWWLERHLPQPDVIKIDTEGAELAILRGGQQLLQTHHPLLMLELSDAALRAQGDSAIALLQFLRSLDYRIFAISHRTGQPVYVPDSCLELTQLSDNVIAAHPARTWAGLPTWDSLDQTTDPLPVVYQQLVRSQWETEQLQMALTRSQAQLQQIQATMARLQVDYTHTKQWQLQAEQERNHAQDKVIDLSELLRQAYSQLDQTQQQLNAAEQWIGEVQNSAFWQLRNRWMRMKKTLGLPSLPTQPYRRN